MKQSSICKTVVFYLIWFVMRRVKRQVEVNECSFWFTGDDDSACIYKKLGWGLITTHVAVAVEMLEHNELHDNSIVSR